VISAQTHMPGLTPVIVGLGNCQVDFVRDLFTSSTMHDARAIANFFLDRASEKSRPITAMTLLKVLYFAHAWHLAKYERPLVAQPFEAWQHGPVSRIVYEQLRAMGSKPVTKKLTTFDPASCLFRDTPYHFDNDMTLFLEHIFDYYSQFHPFKLSDLTHEEGSPWEIVWAEAERRAVPGMIIPDSLIMKWLRDGGGSHVGQKRRGYSI
jgi:uncharacterized phage-associated protein